MYKNNTDSSMINYLFNLCTKERLPYALFKRLYFFNKEKQKKIWNSETTLSPFF